MKRLLVGPIRRPTRLHCGRFDLVSDTFCLRDEIGSHREFGAHSDTNLDCYLRPSSNTRLDSTSTSRLLYAKDGLRKIITRIGNVSLQLDGRIRHHRIMRRRFALSWRRDRARLEMRPKNEAEITIHRDIGWGRRRVRHVPSMLVTQTPSEDVAALNHKLQQRLLLIVSQGI